MGVRLIAALVVLQSAAVEEHTIDIDGVTFDIADLDPEAGDPRAVAYRLLQRFGVKWRPSLTCPANPAVGILGSGKGDDGAGLRCLADVVEEWVAAQGGPGSGDASSRDRERDRWSDRRVRCVW